ncbi:MAG: class I SAM-dependent methyltransferase [Ignavibacteriales bacterium]
MQNKVCPSFLSGAFNNKLRLLLHNPHSILGDYIKRGDVVADIGCGPGFFSLALAEMVGKEGCVLAVDIQKEMLDKLQLAAQNQDLQSRIKLHQCNENSLNIDEKVDFALAFWMVHEVPNTKRFFDEVVTILKPGGLFLMVEPKIHTSFSTFQKEINQACSSGLQPHKGIKVNFSRALLFDNPFS